MVLEAPVSQITLTSNGPRFRVGTTIKAESKVAPTQNDGTLKNYKNDFYFLIISIVFCARVHLLLGLSMY